tara:strand:+ start:280 stop:1008 length:729 start_codon:yes stop_codon:yes gene_type:complete
MFLAIDIGNSNVTCGVYHKNKWLHQERILSNFNFWNNLTSLKKFNISKVAISSVVPKLTDIYKESIINLFHLEPLIITHLNSGINLNVEFPKEVGTDRICNIVAALKLVGSPCIIGDIGSATNYDVLDVNGDFIGGAIAPGLETAAYNLFEKAALIKETAFIVPELTIGKNTSTNLQSGIMFGAIDVIDGMFKRIILETGWSNSHQIITGGFGKLISNHLKTKHQLIPTLTLDGIRIIYDSQ